MLGFGTPPSKMADDRPPYAVTRRREKGLSATGHWQAAATAPQRGGGTAVRLMPSGLEIANRAPCILGGVIACMPSGRTGQAACHATGLHGRATWEGIKGESGSSMRRKENSAGGNPRMPQPGFLAWLPRTAAASDLPTILAAAANAGQ